MKRILITGAAGKIGNALRQGLRGNYSLIRLADIASLGRSAAGEELATTDIRDMSALEKAMVGIECVVHLAGVPEEAEWDQVLRSILKAATMYSRRPVAAASSA